MLPEPMREALRKRVRREVPGDSGFRTWRTRTEYERFALYLQDAGHGEDWIVSTLTDLYDATVEGYGD